jgi:hypothetical protein
MLKTWTGQNITVAKDIRTLSLNVLAALGVHRSFPFQPSSVPSQTADPAAPYRDALSTVLDNIILLTLVPYQYLLLPRSPEFASAHRKG